MGISTTALGTNSFQIDYTTGTTQADLLTAIKNAITNSGANDRGWEAYDLAAGSNAIAFRALNKDGVTYKYVVVDINTTSVLLLKTYETWDSSAHTGTNLCYNSDSATYGAKYITTGPGQLFVFVNARWLAMLSRDVVSGQLNYNSSYQGLIGCFEVARDNAEDTAAANYPPFFWTNTSNFFMTAFACCGFSPRTRDGSTGANAKIEIATILGKTVGTTTKAQSFVPSTTNVWNAKDWGLTLYVHEPSNSVRGRAFGLKLFTMTKLLLLDKSTIKVNSDYIYSVSGTDADHHVIVCSTTATAKDGRVLIPA